MHRDDELGSARVRLHLLPQRRHVHVNGADVAYVVVSPQLFEYLVPREGATRVPHEEREQVELPGLEAQLLTVERRLVGVYVHDKGA